MDIIKSPETRGEREESEQERIKREVTEDIEAAMEIHRDEPFHNERHPKNVVRDALRIVDIFEMYTDEVTPDIRLATKTGADIHDLVVDYAIQEDPEAFNYGQRIRFRGFGKLMPDNVKKILRELGETKGNEEKSLEKGELIIKKHDPEGKVYNPMVMEATKEIVAATYPDHKMDSLPKEYITDKGEIFIRDPKTGEVTNIAPYLGRDKEGNIIALHFSNPMLKRDSKISTLAGVYGDIMYGGKVDFLKFKTHGNEEFRELHEIIRKDVLGGIDQLTGEKKAKIAKTALDWISTQVSFLLWKKIDSHNILENFEAIEKSRDPEALKKALSDEYSMFDSNIIDSVKRVENARARWGSLVKPDIYETDSEAETAFRELLGEMGF